MAVLESHNGYYLWHYIPSIPAAGIFTALFTISFFALGYKMFRTRTWFSIPFLVGVLFEMVGYVGRAISHNNTAALGPYIMQSTLLLLAPALFAATIYMCLGRLIRSVGGTHLSIVPVRIMTPIFVAGDVFSFLVQGSGAGMMAGGKQNSFKLGSNIVMAGLIIQILIFGFFVVAAGLWQRRFANSVQEARTDGRWKGVMAVLYGASGLILVRSVFRVIEYGQGNDGYLLSQEWTIYIFDAVLMWIMTVIFFWKYPAGVNSGSLAAPPPEVSRMEMGTK